MEKSRLHLPDRARGVGVLLVILSHLDVVKPEVLTWISTFHMPLFFVLSGVTMSLWSDRSESLNEQVKRRSRSLLIPYLWFSLLYFLVDIGNLMLRKIDGRRFYENAVASLSFSGKSVLWYVSALLLSQLLLLCILRIEKRTIRIFVITLIACVCVGGSYLWRRAAEQEISVYLVPFMYIAKALLRVGVVLPFVAAARAAALMLKGKGYPVGRGLRLLAGLICLALSILISHYHWSDTNNLRLGNPLMYYAGGIAGSVAVIALLSVLPELKILSRIGRDSLVILAVHLDLYVLWAGTKLAGLVMRVVSSEVLYVIITVTVTVLLGLMAARVIDRFFPFVLKGFRGRDKKAATV